MAKFDVTTTALENMATEIEQHVSEFRNCMNEGSAIVTSIDKVLWDSDAHLQFQSQYQKLEANLEQFPVVLNSYANFLREAASVYQSTDNKVLDDTSVLNADSLFTSGS